MTSTETTTIQHPSWCDPKCCSVRWYSEEKTLFGEHSTGMVEIESPDKTAVVSIVVSQFLGWGNSVAEPAVRMLCEADPYAYLDIESADQVTSALAAAAGQLRDALAAGDHLPVNWLTDDD